MLKIWLILGPVGLNLFMKIRFSCDIRLFMNIKMQDLDVTESVGLTLRICKDIFKVLFCVSETSACPHVEGF